MLLSVWLQLVFLVLLHFVVSGDEVLIDNVSYICNFYNVGYLYNCLSYHCVYCSLVDGLAVMYLAVCCTLFLYKD